MDNQPQKVSSKTEAVGSVWNPNSWHWEQKDYSERVKSILESRMLQVILEDVEGKVKMVEVVAKGEAELMIRKGK